MELANLKIRHPKQRELVISAAEGQAQAVNDMLLYLSSANPNLCKIMQDTIHDCCEAEIWSILLDCLATHRLGDGINCDRRTNSDASKRIDLSIIEVFLIDEHAFETDIKEKVLSQAMEDPEPKICQAAAYIAGMRGDLRAVPILAETIQTGNRDWQLRAVKALVVIGDVCCVPPLVCALTMNREKLHREARRALIGMGKIAEPAWVDLLKHPDSHIRWEAARGLGDIGDASAAPILVEGLLDSNYAVRWATADVLARLGERALPAILKFISYQILNEGSRQAAYHALHGIKSRETRKRLEPLLNALRISTASGEASAIAQRMQDEWECS
jgi:HEAT repeat protein